eukprot:TRINITY_DN16102_c0_g1_i1.p1 TRINITY_DN16102_c0_g1~~TRINITY_DN16102_c0_g1_i1.p1  ORF type:complete len:72 (+),score=19.17 TRINITY_DN16102_c0_g1_i1:60-275(+)
MFSILSPHDTRNLIHNKEVVLESDGAFKRHVRPEELMPPTFSSIDLSKLAPPLDSPTTEIKKRSSKKYNIV